MTYEALRRRSLLLGYAECADRARSLCGPAAAFVAEFAVECARSRGWEPAADLVALAATASAADGCDAFAPAPVGVECAGPCGPAGRA